VSFNVGEENLAASDVRNGFFYVMDRTNGKLKSAAPFVEKITGAKSIDIATGCAIPLEGKNWMPMSYSQKTGLFYVPANEWGMDIWNEPVTY
jgi:alcohol dehydrogenase (cytochrome c)